MHSSIVEAVKDIPIVMHLDLIHQVPVVGHVKSNIEMYVLRCHRGGYRLANKQDLAESV
jgi:hypothetical protein